MREANLALSEPPKMNSISNPTTITPPMPKMKTLPTCYLLVLLTFGLAGDALGTGFVVLGFSNMSSRSQGSESTSSLSSSIHVPSGACQVAQAIGVDCWGSPQAASIMAATNAANTKIQNHGRLINEPNT